MAFGVRFDNYYLESSLYSDGRVDATIDRLAASGMTYEATARCGSRPRSSATTRIA